MPRKPKTSVSTKSRSKSKMEVFEVSTPQVAYLFGVSDRQIRNWVNDMSCPKLAHGLFDLKAVLDWWIDSDLIGARLEASDDDIKAVKLEYWRWKTENEKIKARQISGELIQRSAVIPSWAYRFTEVKSYLIGQQPDRIPSMLDVDEATHEQIRSVILKENRRALESFSRDGEFTPKDACNAE
jgi:hypothetical protein